MNSETLKKLKSYVPVFLCMSMAAFLFSASCAKYETDMVADVEMEEESDPNGMVTVKKSDSGIVYFQLGGSTLEPVGWTSKFTKEYRAFINYSELSEASEDFTKKVRVNWIASIRTTDASAVGKPSLQDPVVLYTDWQTVCEDGYMTIHFAVQGRKKSIDKHKFSLLVDKNEPTRMYFLHDKNGDKGYYICSDSWFDSYVFQAAVERGETPRVTITRFIPDLLKAGGRYETATETVRKVDPIERKLILERKAGLAGSYADIRMDDILSLEPEEPR